jgi:hypothetical protein
MCFRDCYRDHSADPAFDIVIRNPARDIKTRIFVRIAHKVFCVFTASASELASQQTSLCLPEIKKPAFLPVFN